MPRTPTIAPPGNRTPARPAPQRKSPPVPESATFPPGSLESKLLALGEAVPKRAWSKLPTDFFANLDHHLCGAPRKK